MATPQRLALVLLLALAAGAQAQQVYRIVGPDGKVTFSDRPAPTSSDRAPAGSVAPVESQSNGPGVNTALLPYELRLVAQRYPVMLYSGPGCAPCGDARALLQGRGIPFIEKTIGTAADADALKRISGGSNLPYATIGSQALQGFSKTEWAQYLDLAGYPQESQLPPNYRAPAPSPLAAASPARQAPAAAPQRPAARPGLPAPSANPSGIQF